MKRLLLPISLITFAVICLSIVHIDNINKLETKSKELKEKYESKIGLEEKAYIHGIIAEM